MIRFLLACLLALMLGCYELQALPEGQLPPGTQFKCFLPDDDTLVVVWTAPKKLFIAFPITGGWVRVTGDNLLVPYLDCYVYGPDETEE